MPLLFVSTVESVRAVPRGLGMGLSRGAFVREIAPQFLADRSLGAARRLRPSTSSRARTVVAAVGTVDPAGIVSGTQVISTLVVSAAACLGAVFLSQNLEPQQGRLQGREPCPACGGTGYEVCFCSKWSDGDAGCNTCGHTGYMRCRSCGGGGTAVPLPITVRKEGPGSTGF